MADTIHNYKDAHPQREKQEEKRSPSAPSSQIFLAATSLLETSRKAAPRSAVSGISENSGKKGRMSR